MGQIRLLNRLHLIPLSAGGLASCIRGILVCLCFLTAGEAPAADGGRAAGETIRVGPATFVHEGGGVFAIVDPEGVARGETIALRGLRHPHDPLKDPDVPLFTDVTLPGVVPDLRDAAGRPYALITLYNIDPPLEDLPSREQGVDRGMDLRDPSNLIKAAYANYVSPVLTNDAERRPTPGHPIGHFYVKVEIPGFPAILTGMTTTERADVELVDFTLGRRLGLGGVLLTPEPGRLNSAAEAVEELSLRQRELLVVDGVNFRDRDGENVGPKFVIEDGNVSFARFRLPVENARDALGVFLGFVARGQHGVFGSLLSRPSRGTGAGCSAFAMSWLKGAGVIPFVDESGPTRDLAAVDVRPDPGAPLWLNFHNRLILPWGHIGCDERVGLAGPPQEARYTIHDLLFHGLDRAAVTAASQGFADLVRRESGPIAGTLFRYGALTPLRDIAISMKRKDPDDQGDYDWAEPAEGLSVGFWDNGRFADWVKRQWSAEVSEEELAQRGLRRVREGRFHGVEVDAMATPRQAEPFFDRADERDRLLAWRARFGAPLTSCVEVFQTEGLW